MSRSTKKGPYIDERLMKKISKLRVGDKTVINTWSRNCTIVPEMVGFIIGVHNGKQHIAVSVTENMIGHKLGEFSATRKFARHGGKIQKAAEQAAATKNTASTKSVMAGKK